MSSALLMISAFVAAALSASSTLASPTPASRMSAANPATKADDRDVPMAGMSLVSPVSPRYDVDTTGAPGATTSGFLRPETSVGPRALSGSTVSSARVVVPCGSMAPTVMVL